MKQMLTVAGGVFFAVSLTSLIFAGMSIFQTREYEQELAKRGQIEKTLSGWTGLEEFNKQKLQGMQNFTTGSFVVAGISGALGIGLAIAGSNKTSSSH